LKQNIFIKTDEQLTNCIHFKVDVEVWFGGLFDGFSKIISYSDVAVTLEDGQYLRDNSIIKARRNYFVLVKRLCSLVPT
jgi:hypothetical protein